MKAGLIAFSARRPLAALLLLCTLAWLPGFFTLPPLDRDESRFAQATKQMLETGDFVEIRLGENPRYEKPIGIYWLQAVSTSLLGEGARNQIWTYRVPSYLGALAAVAVTFSLARAIAGVEAAFCAGVLLGFSVLLMSEAKIAKTDAVLLATIVAVQAILMRVYLSAREPAHYPTPPLWLVYLGWVAFGVSLLIKGPVVMAVAGATVLALLLWDRETSWLKRLHALGGIGLVLLTVLPWAIAIGIASHGLFYEKSLGGDFAMKLAGDQESHGAPPGYFAALAHLTFWPGSLVLLPCLVSAVRRRKDPAIRFLLAWLVPAWLMFELVPTKLPHYILPAYPALAILGGIWLAAQSGKDQTEKEMPEKEGTGPRLARYASLIFFTLAAFALGAFLIVALGRFGTGVPLWYYAAVAIGLAPALAVTPLFLKDRRIAALAMASASAILLYAVAGFAAVPRLDGLWLSPKLAAAIERHAAPNDPPAITAGYAEPSINFLLGTQTALLDGEAAGALASQRGGLVLVEELMRADFLQALAGHDAHAEPLEELAGLNYSRGRNLRITLYRVALAAK